MALHSQCKTFLDQVAASGARPLHEMAPADFPKLARAAAIQTRDTTRVYCFDRVLARAT